MDREIFGAIIAASRPRALAALMRVFRDVDTAEDLFQEACLRAARRWPGMGLPDEPTAWLIQVARNAGIDRARRDRRMSGMDEEDVAGSGRLLEDVQSQAAELIDRSAYKDDVLRLMFLCCHPNLKVHDQLALALKVVVGFSVAEIARAFVVRNQTMQRRLSRAKERASALAPGLEMPSATERASRLGAVRTMVYLLFNEGYSASQGDAQIRHALSEEAIRLARLLLSLFPEEVETMGLLALCLLQHARAAARCDAQGRLVSLKDQDRSLWDAQKIAEGRILVEKALMRGTPGPLQVQAAIAAVHCTAKRADDTDWAEIERLYEALDTLTPGPIVSLNRAVAVAKLHGPDQALAMLAPLAHDLAEYRPYHSVRAAFLEENGNAAAAVAALKKALICSPTAQEEGYMSGKVAGLEEWLSASSV